MFNIEIIHETLIKQIMNNIYNLFNISIIEFEYFHQKLNYLNEIQNDFLMYELYEIKYEILAYIKTRLNMLNELILNNNDNFIKIKNTYKLPQIDYFYCSYILLAEKIHFWNTVISKQLEKTVHYIDLYNEDIKELNILFNLENKN